MLLPVAMAHVARLAGLASTEFGMAMRQLAGGVSLVTSGKAPARAGFTAASVSLLSADPPLLIVAIDRESEAYAEIGRRKCFAVSILAAQHDALAARFGASSGTNGEACFIGSCWHTLATGAPLLCDALAAVDCELEELIERRSHAIAVGRVVAIQAQEVGDALLHWRGDYHHLPQIDHEHAAAQWGPILRARNMGSG